MGVIHDDELSGVFKLSPRHNFLHILCIMFVALFPIKLCLYWIFISLLNNSFQLIRPNIRFKVIHVFKPFIIISFLFFQCHWLRKKYLDSSISVKLVPSSTASSSFYLYFFFWYINFVKSVLTIICVYLNAFAYTKIYEQTSLPFVRIFILGNKLIQNLRNLAHPKSGLGYITLSLYYLYLCLCSSYKSTKIPFFIFI